MCPKKLKYIKYDCRFRSWLTRTFRRSRRSGTSIRLRWTCTFRQEPSALSICRATARLDTINDWRSSVQRAWCKPTTNNRARFVDSTTCRGWPPVRSGIRLPAVSWTAIKESWITSSTWCTVRPSRWSSRRRSWQWVRSLQPARSPLTRGK